MIATPSFNPLTGISSILTELDEAISRELAQSFNPLTGISSILTYGKVTLTKSDGGVSIP